MVEELKNIQGKSMKSLKDGVLDGQKENEEERRGMDLRLKSVALTDLLVGSRDKASAEEKRKRVI